MNTPSFREDHISQIPALQLLQNLGWVYMPPDLALHNRGGKESNVILERVLEERLRRINHIQFKGQTHKFSDSNIRQAIEALKEVPLKDGLIRANEQVYDLLTLGKSFEQRIDGDKKSHSLHYIDWEHPENNLFTVTEEYTAPLGFPVTVRGEFITGAFFKSFNLLLLDFRLCVTAALPCIIQFPKAGEQQANPNQNQQSNYRYNNFKNAHENPRNLNSIPRS